MMNHLGDPLTVSEGDFHGPDAERPGSDCRAGGEGALVGQRGKPAETAVGRRVQGLVQPLCGG